MSALAIKEYTWLTLVERILEAEIRGYPSRYALRITAGPRPAEAPVGAQTSTPTSYVTYSAPGGSVQALGSLISIELPPGALEKSRVKTQLSTLHASIEMVSGFASGAPGVTKTRLPESKFLVTSIG